MDQDLLDQLDQLQQGARDLNASYEPRQASSPEFSTAYGDHNQQYRPQHAYGDSFPNSVDNYPDQPMQLDSFDERLLRQPDHDSRHWQAAQGHARLSLPPAPSQSITRAGHTESSFRAPQSAVSRSNLAHFAFSPAPNDAESPSPGRSAQLSSPAFNASQRHPAPFNDCVLGAHLPRAPQGQHQRTAFHHSQPKHRPPGRLQYDQAFDQSSRDEASPQQPFLPSRRTDVPQLNSPPRTVQSGTPVVQGVQLIATRELPDRFRSMFNFPLFNAVQSKCFHVVFRTNDNFVLSSPTGSGKTAILELAICRLVHGYNSGSFKIIYMAPTKSLCSERVRDWQAKFGTLDLQCAELTGDTDNAQLRNVQHASIIITTPEKWDSMTRKWKDHQRLMQMVKLFLIDEVHILKEDRGPTLEAVVSRMKSVGSDVRFLALSATVPNSQDIATWLGKDAMNPQIPAPREKFGEEFRPVRLQKHVCGYQSGSNDFAFEKLLDGKLTDVIAKWSQRKPLMVFCMTRKACVVTARLLANWWCSKGPRDRYWSAPRGRIVVADKELRDTAASGVAFHHAGLTIEDRAAVEKGYLAGELNVICCTSTLAVGVNLPCHMVVIKGTVSFQNGGCIKEYSDLETMQMLGRAGRPQFDKSAVAVVMTRLQRVPFYENMIAGTEVLESCLHEHLIDHLNAEIGLGTVANASSAKKWLTGTFLYVRLKDNPEHYKLEGEAQGRTLDERLEHICRKGISQLEDYNLVQGGPKLHCTEFGDSMARYYIQFDTMKLFLALKPKAKISEILSTISQAAEFKDIRFRAGEKPFYKELNKNPSMKFPIPVNIDLTAHKVSLIIQSVLGAIDIPTEEAKHRQEYNTNKAIIFQHAHRLIRCIIDCQLHLEDSVSARSALMLARSFGAQVWDDSPLHMKQLEGIGLVAVRKLVAAGLKSIEDLANTDPGRIEKSLSRNPPFGSMTQQKAMAFPQLHISMKTAGEPVINRGEGVTIKVKADIGFLNEKVPEMFHRKPVYVCLLADTSSGRKAHFARIGAKRLGKGQEIPFAVTLTSHGQVVRGYLMCDGIAGTQRMATLKPEIPAFMFPSPKTHSDANHQSASPVNAPNTFKLLATAGTQARIDSGSSKFGEPGLDDTATVAASFTNIEDFDDDGNENTSQKKTYQKGKSSVPESTQMLNGKWTCNHACKNKTTCKHGACCREGLEKKPKPPKSKEPKKNEQLSDPRQTQLDLTKTKKQDTFASIQSPPARKPLGSKEVRNLNTLHNSIKTSTNNVPLLSGPGKHANEVSPALRDEFDDDDFGMDTLGSDDFPTAPLLFATQAKAYTSSPQMTFDPHDVGDDMLDMPDDMHSGSPANDLEGLSAFADQLHTTDPSNEWYVEDSAADYVGANRGEVSPLSSLEHSQTKSPVPVLALSNKNRALFVTGESTDSIEDNLALVHGALPDTSTYTHQTPKRHLEDAVPGDGSQFLSASKQPRLQSQDRSGLALRSERRYAAAQPMSVEGNEFSAEFAGLTKPEPNTKVEESMEEWFEKNLGSEFFQLV